MTGLPTNQLDNLDAENDAVILMPVPATTPAKIKSYAAGTVIEAKVSNHAGGRRAKMKKLYGVAACTRCGVVFDGPVDEVGFPIEDICPRCYTDSEEFKEEEDG